MEIISVQYDNEIKKSNWKRISQNLIRKKNIQNFQSQDQKMNVSITVFSLNFVCVCVSVWLFLANILVPMGQNLIKLSRCVVS